jgi:hypothetical protein
MPSFSFRSPFSADFWIISRLKRENSVVFTIIVDEYAKERGIKRRSARTILERRLKILVKEGIVERLEGRPITYKLKRLPLQFILPSNRDFRLHRDFDSKESFDLKYNSRTSKTLGKAELNMDRILDFIKGLRKLGLRVITKANAYRQKGLLRAQRNKVTPGSTEYKDIAFLYKENIRFWDDSVLVFMNDNGDFMISRTKTRFNDPEKVAKQLDKSSKALEEAYKRHKYAVMITLTVPHIFPLVVPIQTEKGKIIGFVPLQDSIITKLKASMMAWLRRMWEGRKIEVFTAYEYHGDYVLHLHIIVFGIPYLLSWDRKYGKKREDVFTYYIKKYNIPIPHNLMEKVKKCKLEKVKDKTEISKYIFTSLLDRWLQRILAKFKPQSPDLLESYLSFKKKKRLQGPVNDIRSIKNGKWNGKPPKDAVIQYSSGAAYRKVVSPKDYVLKYVLKMVSILSQPGGIDSIPEEEQGKVFGYWLFGKRNNSYSPSLVPRVKTERIPSWHYVGIFNRIDLPDYVTSNLILDLS